MSPLWKIHEPGLKAAEENARKSAWVGAGGRLSWWWVGGLSAKKTAPWRGQAYLYKSMGWR